MTSPFDNFVLPNGISTSHNKLTLKFVENIAGFDLLDFYSGSAKVKIGDDADYLMLFMAMASKIAEIPNFLAEPVLITSDSGGHRLFVKSFTAAEKEKYRYGYVALGAAGKEIPEAAIHQQYSFFAEITHESGSDEDFEKAARKTLRFVPQDSKSSWERIINEKLDFIKTDLYAYHLLKLFSWGFQIIGQDGKPESEAHFVRPKPGKARGTDRK